MRGRIRAGGLPFLIAIISMLFAAVSVGPVILAAVTPPPLTFPGQPWTVASPVRPGDVLLVHATRCNHEAGLLVYTFTRSYVSDDGSGRTYPIPGGSSFMHPGCQTFDSRLNFLPLDMKPGRYHLEGTATGVGRWRTAVVVWRTQTFVVLPPTGG